MIQLFTWLLWLYLSRYSSRNYSFGSGIVRPIYSLQYSHYLCGLHMSWLMLYCYTSHHLPILWTTTHLHVCSWIRFEYIYTSSL